MHPELPLRRDRSSFSRQLLGNHPQHLNPHTSGIDSGEQRSAPQHHRHYPLAKYLRTGKKLINFLSLFRLWLARLPSVPCPWWQG